MMTAIDLSQSIALKIKTQLITDRLGFSKYKNQQQEGSLGKNGKNALFAIKQENKQSNFKRILTTYKGKSTNKTVLLTTAK